MLEDAYELSLYETFGAEFETGYICRCKQSNRKRQIENKLNPHFSKVIEALRTLYLCKLLTMIDSIVRCACHTLCEADLSYVPFRNSNNIYPYGESLCRKHSPQL